MKTIAEQILSGLNKFYAAFQTKRVLKTMEEVEANTSEANLVAAPVVAELNDKLAGCSFEQEGNDFYIVGADAVRKKLGSIDAQIVAMGTFEYIEVSMKKTTASVKVIVEEGESYVIAIGGYENNTSTESISNFKQIEKKRIRHGSGFTATSHSSTPYSGSGALIVFIGEAVSNSITITTNNSTSNRMNYCVIKI